MRLITENIGHFATQSIRNVLQRSQRDILFAEFKPVQSRVAQAYFTGELHVREIAAFFAEKHRKLFCEPLRHDRILRLSASHICYFCNLTCVSKGGPICSGGTQDAQLIRGGQLPDRLISFPFRYNTARTNCIDASSAPVGTGFGDPELTFGDGVGRFTFPGN
jgi:hypothetical protein